MAEVMTMSNLFMRVHPKLRRGNVMKKETSERYYMNTFSFRLTCYHGEVTIGMIIVDAVYAADYESIHKVVYKGPEIIDKSFCFYGVDIEYVAR